MAYGVPPKNTHTLPAGRRSFAGPAVTDSARRDVTVVRPDVYADGQDRMGTPQSNQHDGSAANKGYQQGEKYRAALRPAPYGTSNETVHSKNTKRYGRNPTTGDIQGSTGEQPASLYRSGPASSALAASSRGGPARPHVEVVGHAPDGSGKFKHATHPNADRGLHGNSHAPTVPVDRGGARAPDTLPRSSDLRKETGTDSP
jgi:hypothetical protein